ncbi:MAG: tetratricopeptide repeat protein [Terriglobales bacterium]|jgi:Flp pilus assembly protein TadD
MPSSREKNVVIYALLLVAATLVFYNPVVRNQFVDFDDLSYIVKNNHVLSGVTWTTVKWSFSTFRDGNWHPLTWLSHALDCQIFHLNPLGHHYTSLLLHTTSAVLLFLLLWRATGFIWSSLIVAALFALHPTSVESVAWAAERKNVLSMLFFLLALHAYDRYARGGGRYLYWLVSGLFALGLLAKAQIVTLPFVLLLWDYWPLQRMNFGSAITGSATDGSPAAPAPRSLQFLVLEKWPLFVLAAADSVVTVMAQRAGSSVRTLEEVSMSLRWQNVFISYVRYIGKAFWPTKLVPLYPRPVNSLPAWQVLGAAAILLSLSALAIHYRDRRYLPVGWFWFLGTLVPMIGIVTVGEQAMADRYGYLPFIGLFIAVVWTLGELASKYAIRPVWLAASAVAVLFVMGSLTYRQIGYWHDNETLWRYTLSVAPEGNYTAQSNLALALAKAGEPEEALLHFHTAKAMHKYSVEQILALGAYELHVRHSQEALAHSTEALHESSDPKVQAAALAESGQAQLQLHLYDQATESYRNALRLNPDDGQALTGLAVLALRQGQSDVAIADLEHAVKSDPNDVNVLVYVQALRRVGRSAEADSAAEQVQKISQDPGQAQFDAGQLLYFAGVKPL